MSLFRNWLKREDWWAMLGGFAFVLGLGLWDASGGLWRSLGAGVMGAALLWIADCAVERAGRNFRAELARRDQEMAAAMRDAFRRAAR